MDDGNPTQTGAHHHQGKNLIRSKFSDVMVKVDEDIYYLDRLRLALKSKYFEILFTNDSSDRNKDVVEMPLLDSETFSLIVDIVYDDGELESIVKADNFLPLLMAMDYLQMKVDEKTYRDLVFDLVGHSLQQHNHVSLFKLYHFLAETGHYQSLLSVVFKLISEHLEYLQDLDEFLSIPLDHFTQIIRKRLYLSSDKCQKQTFSKICTKWIYHDAENRLPHAIDIVNAARYRIYFSNDVPKEALDLLQLSATDSRVNQDKFSRNFYKMLAYASGEICSSVDVSNTNKDEDESSGDESDEYKDENESSEDESDEYKDENESSEDEKEKNKKKRSHTRCYSWYSDDSSESEEIPEDQHFFNSQPNLKTFLRNSTLYDVTVKVGEKTYKLHRSVLRSASSYFEEIFSTESTDKAVQCSGASLPSLPSKDEVYSIDGIDSEIFDIMIDYIYLGKKKFKSGTVVRLFKALHVLKINGLLNKCCDWIQANYENIGDKDVVEILNFTHEKVEYKDINRKFITKYIVNSWPEIDNLPQFAELFKAISVPTETGSHHDNKVNLLDKIDRDTFKMIINHIYEIKSVQMILRDENVIRILKASEIFKTEALIEPCMNHLTYTFVALRLSSADVIEVLNFARRNLRYYEALYTMYLPRYMMDWPRVDESLFCSISFEHLENLLTSAHFSLDDPRQILDMCSKWIIHDTENRYSLIPRIALAISQNRIVDSDEYAIENPADLNNCSQDFIKYKMKAVLVSTSVLPFALLSRNETRKQETELPAFIVTNNVRFRILNFDWDEIASFALCKNGNDTLTRDRYAMSATMINDSLFILCAMSSYESYFHVYNFSLKKLFSLASDLRICQKDNNDRRKHGLNEILKYTLLNCRNEIYCCVENGTILKYLFELNRWMKFAEGEPDKYGIRFTSDGNELYRIYPIEQMGAERMSYSCTVEIYDFQQNSWVSVPSVRRLFPHNQESDEYRIPLELISIHNYGFAVLFKNKLCMFDHETRNWHYQRPLPHSYCGLYHTDFSIINGDETGKILYVTNNELYCFSLIHRNWTLKKTWPMQEIDGARHKILPYENIIAIHNPINSYI